ncbi:hypothetical protein GEMRC1_005430 [Eukaryota sp. GEM-RC1]
MALCECFDEVLLYETPSELILVGLTSSQLYRMMRVSRTRPANLNITQDETLYTDSALQHLLSSSNQTPKLILKAKALFGFLKLHDCYHMILISSVTRVASVLNRPIYQVADVISFSLSQEPLSATEASYRALLELFDWQALYFCPSLDLSHTLQHLCISSAKRSSQGCYPQRQSPHDEPRSDFVWNSTSMHSTIPTSFRTNFIYGHVSERTILPSHSSSAFTLTLVNRRSRLYAGPRYLKRGVSMNGNAANFIESEVIVSTSCSCSCMLETRRWGFKIKPKLTLTRRDPYCSATRLHFSDLFFKYNAPIFVVDLLSKKKTGESILSRDYQDAIEFINSKCIPESIKSRHDGDMIKYCNFDFRNEFNSHDHDLTEFEDGLSFLALDLLSSTKFFHCQLIPQSSSRILFKVIQQQKGIVRINCVDSTDRTAAFQTFLNMVRSSSPLTNTTSDVLSYQYSGSLVLDKVGLIASDVVNKKLGRKVTVHLQRYVSNQFLDHSKQLVFNLITKWSDEFSGCLLTLKDDDVLHEPPVSWWNKYILKIDDFAWIEDPLVKKRQCSIALPFEKICAYLRPFVCPKCSCLCHQPPSLQISSENLVIFEFSPSDDEPIPERKLNQKRFIPDRNGLLIPYFPLLFN